MMAVFMPMELDKPALTSELIVCEKGVIWRVKVVLVAHLREPAI